MEVGDRDLSDRSITLHEPDGSTLDVTLVTAGTRAGLPSATFELDFGAWERVESHGLLHADPARSRSAARPFDSAKTVQVEAVVDPVAAIDGVDALADRMLSATSSDPLLSTEAWWALSATQEIDLPSDLRGTGTLHEGLSYEHPAWLQDAAGSVGLEEAWQRAMELQDRIDAESLSPMLDLVIDLFAEQDWDIDRPNPEATIIHAGVASDAGDFDLYVRTDEEKHLITAISVLLHDVPTERIGAVHELAARLNVKSAVGSFEVDAETGLLSFKSAIDLTGDHLSSALVRALVGRVLIGGERANAPFADVAAGRATPVAAADAVDL
jgi:hypothetical protein